MVTRSTLVTAALCGVTLAQADARPAPAPALAPVVNTAAAPMPTEPARHAFAPRLQRVAFDRPHADGPLWASGNAWKASFDGTGMTMIPFFGSEAPRNYPLRVELASASVGGVPLALEPGTPTQVVGNVHTPRGALAELITPGLDTLEQSWIFDRLPSRDAIAVEVRMTGDYAVSAIDGGLRFTGEYGGFDYTKAIAIDGNGRRLPLAIEWLGERARIEIPQSFVEKATLPIVLDPLFNYWFLLGSAAPAGQIQSQPDVASFQALGGRTLMVWRRQWSLTDQDAWGLMFDGNLGLVATDFTLDFTADDWLKIACASNNYAQNFLVVSEVRLGIQHNIFGRTVSASGVPGGVITIERDGVVGSPGNNFWPDVGGDPYFGPGRYTIVWRKEYLFADSIVMKQVTPAGGLVTTLPATVDANPEQEQKPSIGKSCGSAAGTQNWLMAWQRRWAGSPNDQEIWGRYVSWNGVLQGTSSFYIAITPAEETAPAACSPIDVAGERLWPVVHEIASTSGQPRDVVCNVMRADGTVSSQFNVNTGIPGADDWDPEVDSDGTRFTVTFSVNQDVEVATFAILPGGTSREDARSGISQVGLNDCGQTNIVADYSGGGLQTPRYCVAYTDVTTNTFNLAAWGGFAGGANMFTFRDSYCFNDLPITASGSSAIGQTVNIQVLGGSPLAAMAFGLPQSLSLFPFCNCLQGTDQTAIVGPTLNWTVPNKPIYVGIDLSVQGFAITGTECFDLVNISDIVDFRIR
jgi:hypothetical protein